MLDLALKSYQFTALAGVLIFPWLCFSVSVDKLLNSSLAWGSISITISNLLPPTVSRIQGIFCRCILLCRGSSTHPSGFSTLLYYLVKYSILLSSAKCRFCQMWLCGIFSQFFLRWDRVFSRWLWSHWQLDYMGRTCTGKTPGRQIFYDNVYSYHNIISKILMISHYY